MNRFQISSLFTGFALLITGAALIYHPLGYLVAGAGLLLAGLPKRPAKTGGK